MAFILSKVVRDGEELKLSYFQQVAENIRVLRERQGGSGLTLGPANANTEGLVHRNRFGNGFLIDGTSQPDHSIVVGERNPTSRRVNMKARQPNDDQWLRSPQADRSDDTRWVTGFSVGAPAPSANLIDRRPF